MAAERRVAGRYSLLEPIGRGGMGVVWRAHDELLDRTVAVKELILQPMTEEDRAAFNRRTIREARAAGRLSHPNVVVVHDVIEEDGRPWIVMQLVQSRSLGQVLREHGPLVPERVAAIGLQVLDALRAAHAAGVLHRDVKPENVLITGENRVVLTDFGIATMPEEANLTITGGIVGTPAFLPPERIKGDPATPESDLWSLGATLYAAVEGRPPFDRSSAIASMAAVLQGEAAPPVRAGALTPVLAGLLRKNPAERMDAVEAAELLTAIATGASTGAAARPSPPPSSPNPHQPGHQTGHQPGHQTGYQPGYQSGQQSGHWTGHQAGYQTGHQTGNAADPGFPFPGAALLTPPPLSGAPVSGAPASGPSVSVPPLHPGPAPYPGHTHPGHAPPGHAPQHPPNHAQQHAPHHGSAPYAGPTAPSGATPPWHGTPSPPQPHPWQEGAVTAATPRRPAGARVTLLILIPVLFVALVVGAWYGYRTINQSQEPSASPDTSSAGSSPSASAYLSASPSQSGALPQGWTTHRDELGFSIALPPGWQPYAREASRVKFGVPGAKTYLMIDLTSWTDTDQDPMLHMQQLQQNPETQAAFPGYRLIDLSTRSYRNRPAADWEFTWETSGGTAHVLDRAFSTADGRDFAIYWQTPDSQWTKRLSYFKRFAATFRAL